MLQRIQTIYLLIAVGISAGLIFLFNLWTNTEGVSVFAKDEMLYFVLFLVSAVLSLFSIFRMSSKLPVDFCRWEVRRKPHSLIDQSCSLSTTLWCLCSCRYINQNWLINQLTGELSGRSSWRQSEWCVIACKVRGRRRFDGDWRHDG